jgi:hypothetical protein
LEQANQKSLNRKIVKISSDLSTLEYGAYHLIFRVEGDEDELETTDLVLFYEEAISGFKVVVFYVGIVNNFSNYRQIVSFIVQEI